MNAGMANRARLRLSCLAVIRAGRRRGGGVGRWKVALETDSIDIGTVEQAGIGPAVRGMTCRATLGFDRSVLIGPRAGFPGVALEAKGVLRRDLLDAALPEGAVEVVAIGALHLAIVHRVMEGHGKLRLGVRVTLNAERRLRRLEQRLFRAVMNVVATDAAHISFPMRRALEIRVLSLVATQALLIHFFGRGVGRIEYPGFIAPIHVRSARPMAAFAVGA